MSLKVDIYKLYILGILATLGDLPRVFPEFRLLELSGGVRFKYVGVVITDWHYSALLRFGNPEEMFDA